MTDPATVSAAQLLRELKQRPDHDARLACSYGVHDWRLDESAWGPVKVCNTCGGTYLVTEDERLAIERWLEARHG